jgi:hypothetical protein
MRPGSVVWLAFLWPVLSLWRLLAQRQLLPYRYRAGRDVDDDVADPTLASRVTLIARPADANYTVTAVRFLLDGRTLAEVGRPVAMSGAQSACGPDGTSCKFRRFPVNFWSAFLSPRR